MSRSPRHLATQAGEADSNEPLSFLQQLEVRGPGTNQREETEGDTLNTVKGLLQPYCTGNITEGVMNEDFFFKKKNKGQSTKNTRKKHLNSIVLFFT